jgi:hypothetical protein
MTTQRRWQVKHLAFGDGILSYNHITHKHTLDCRTHGEIIQFHGNDDKSASALLFLAWKEHRRDNHPLVETR